MPDNAVARFHQVAPGSHNVAINGMTSNCSTGDQPPFQLVQITAGGSIRDTARVQFTVQCTRTDKIALIQDMQVLVVFADGEYPAYVGTGRGSPAWSPDGNRLVWEGFDCYYDYYYHYYDYCYNVGLRIGNVGGGITALTSDSTDSDPAWSPDGSTIAFVRGGKLLFVTPEGTEVRFWDLLLTPVADPAWSPDGAWLAYTCVIETGNSDICIINRDGLQQRRLTSEAGADSDPSWSPDGTRIAFTTFRYGPESIAHMASMDGTDVIRLEEGRSPSWSRDGQRLVYEKLNHGLAIIGRDGTGRITLSGTRGGQPAWRP
jgi:Tol biopolymer transport system component